MSKRYSLLWLSAMAALQVIDMVTTYTAGPLVAWMWSRYGFWPFVVAKLLLLPFFAISWYTLDTLAHHPACRFDSARASRVFRTILVFEALVPMTIVCVWNTYWLLIWRR